MRMRLCLGLTEFGENKQTELTTKKTNQFGSNVLKCKTSFRIESVWTATSRLAVYVNFYIQAGRHTQILHISPSH